MLKSFSAQTLLLAVAAAVVSHEANIVINEIWGTYTETNLSF